jgi:hypothetical protein
MSDLIKCPRCGSTQLTSSKKGFSAGKAAAGFFLTGGVGLLAGTLGMNKVQVTCLSCGNEFAAGQGKKVYSEEETAMQETEIARILETEGMINALTKVQQYHGGDLPAARAYVDELAERKGIKIKQPKGCAGVILAALALGGLLACLI